MTDRSLSKTMDELFPRGSSRTCRVCAEDVVDGRWNYCSTRCRRIALAVFQMFSWDQILAAVIYAPTAIALTQFPPGPAALSVDALMIEYLTWRIENPLSVGETVPQTVATVMGGVFTLIVLVAGANR